MLFSGLNAGEELSAPSENSVRLTLKPKLCVLNNARQVCVDEVIIEWESDTIIDACLFRSDSLQPRQCWQKSHHGQWVEPVRLRENLTFELLSGDQKLASASVKVLHSYTRPLQRRRSRHPWSLF